VAENSAGRSEVTFKAWFNPAGGEDRTPDELPAATEVVHDGGRDDEAGATNSEVVVGASLGSVVVLVAAAACVVCVVRRGRPCRRKYAYYVRDSHGPTKPPTPSRALPGWLRRLAAVGGRRLLLGGAENGPRANQDDPVGDAGGSDPTV